MADEVIDLGKAREARTPHSAGKARCLACRHEWVAVAPTGMTWLACPACSLERGRFIAQHERDEPHWHCFCGNNLFFVVKDGYYCPNCGEWQKGF